MKNYMKTILSGIQNWTKKEIKDSAADWNETDKTSPTYIKNKPFWKTNIHNVLIDSRELFFEEVVETYNDKYLYKSSINNIPLLSKNYRELLKIQWYIIWDGVEYWDTMYDPDYDYYTIGNDALIDPWHEDSGEPFALKWNSQYSDEPNTILIFTTETSSSHLFEFGYYTLGEKQILSSDYLPPFAGEKIYNENNDICGEIFNDYQANKATGEYSHAEGCSTTASGRYSHAEGFGSDAIGNCSHAEGDFTKANGEYSHAEGRSTKANGKNSHAAGDSTIATGESQYVIGKYNIEDSSNTYCHIVGNGNYKCRSNAYTLDWQGNGWYAGNLTIAGGLITLSDLETAMQYQLAIKNGELVMIECSSLEDFQYNTNEDTYIITGWNETHMSEMSTQFIVPNNESIII